MTGAMGNDSQNQYGGGYAGANPYGAVASSQSPEQVSESGHTRERVWHRSMRCWTTALGTRWRW